MYVCMPFHFIYKETFLDGAIQKHPLEPFSRQEPGRQFVSKSIIFTRLEKAILEPHKACRTLEERAEQTASRGQARQSAQLFPQVCG